ncbi:MAG TPA: PilT/PilU family type 4a pilus ATPase [Thermoanaerobaculia bacterium]|nr:PilT/PilU family type 4a pilus ATPase [Thermoanaerobaculia bacterium]
MDDTEDLNRLIRELNTGVRGDAGADAARLTHWLRALAERGGSDLLLVAGAPPAVRVDGAVLALSEGPLSGEEIAEAVLPALNAALRSRFQQGEIADGSYKVAGLGRFRINLHRERGRAAAAVRALPSRPPRLGSLGLPPGTEALTRLPRGLVLVGGPTGSGKTTTLAALVEEINLRDARHIVTIEDPIEYEHQNLRSVIEQVEIGTDAPDFPTALRSALRQAPDVIVIGEMRDTETMNIALAAGETGHLVFSTLHTSDLATTVARIADSFSSERQPTIRQELAMALTAVFTQMLLPTTTGERVPAAELLMLSYGARQHIRKNGVQHLHQEIALTRKLGSFSLEESLARLVKRGVVPKGEAQLRANHPEEFEHLLATLPSSVS